MSNRPDIVVMGDINLDSVMVGNLPFNFQDLKENGIITWAPIADEVGGSALNLARFAQEAGYKVMLLGKIGDDWAGHFIVKWITKTGIISAVSIDSSSCTGRALIMRDKKDVRLLANNLNNANHSLTIGNIEQYWDSIASCRVLYVSGYCVMDPKSDRYRATVHALKRIGAMDKAKKPCLVFDVVPHRIYKTYSFKQFLELTKHIDIVISEVATIRRFLRLGSRTELIGEAEISEALEQLKLYYTQFILLRYGPSGCDEEILWNSSDNTLLRVPTGHDKASDKRGFGDRLTVNALRDFFHIFSSPASAS